MYKNNIDLIGFLGSDPETRLTSNGIALTSFSLATRSSWKNEAGSYESRTEWHRIVAWGKLAESAPKLSKGAHIEVEGELRHRTYPKEVAVGQKTVAVDIPVSEIHLRTVRKLDRSGNQNESEVTEEAPE
ncbi:MAG: single-stranded DNA-binding protein [Bryobacteraceae bacterium]